MPRQPTPTPTRTRPTTQVHTLCMVLQRSHNNPRHGDPVGSIHTGGDEEARASRVFELRNFGLQFIAFSKTNPLFPLTPFASKSRNSYHISTVCPEIEPQLTTCV